MVTIFVIGVVVAIVIDETTGITPGGIIVPGFLAISWGEPLKMLFTLLAALLTVLIVHHLQRVIFIHGRRRFTYAVLTGIVLKQAFTSLIPYLQFLSYGLLVIGFVIPGLIAENCMRQGVVKTMTAIVIGATVTRLLSGAILGWMP